MNCQNCQTINNKNTKFCKNCGNTLYDTELYSEKRNKKTTILITIFFAILILILLLAGYRDIAVKEVSTHIIISTIISVLVLISHFVCFWLILFIENKKIKIISISIFSIILFFEVFKIIKHFLSFPWFLY